MSTSGTSVSATTATDRVPWRASLLVEWRRYSRTRILVGLVFSFVFCGLAAPPLALYMADLIASAGVDQIVVMDKEVTAADSASLYTQNVGQIAVLVTMGVAVTGLGWDARAGSSIFYRIRSAGLGAVVLPRLILCCVVSLAALVVTTVLWAATTAASIEAPEVGATLRIIVAMGAYTVFAASLGFVLMAWLRRVAVALGLGVGVLLFLPLIAPVTPFDEALPTALMNAQLATTGDLVMPVVVTVVLSVACALGGVAVLGRHTLRRDS